MGLYCGRSRVCFCLSSLFFSLSLPTRSLPTLLRPVRLSPSLLMSCTGLKRGRRDSPGGGGPIERERCWRSCWVQQVWLFSMEKWVVIGHSSLWCFVFFPHQCVVAFSVCLLINRFVACSLPDWWLPFLENYSYTSWPYEFWFRPELIFIKKHSQTFPVLFNSILEIFYFVYLPSSPRWTQGR